MNQNETNNSQPMIISYMTFRKVLGFLGISLVPIMIVGTVAIDHATSLQPSVSHYYYTSMRNGLVGILCCMSLFLLSYHGNEKVDSVTSKFAGIFALGIAFFPTAAVGQKNDIVSTIHFVCAGVFFMLLSCMSIFLFTKSSGYKTKQKIKRNRVYRTCGIIMALASICILLYGINLFGDSITFLHPILILEFIALTSFGISWLIKGELVLGDKTDNAEKNVQNEMQFQTAESPN